MSETITLDNIELVKKSKNKERLIIPDEFRDKPEFEIILIVRRKK